MDNIYSLFYQGQQNQYGIGTWDIKGHKLKHSIPFYIISIKLYWNFIRTYK